MCSALYLRFPLAYCSSHLLLACRQGSTLTRDTKQSAIHVRCREIGGADGTHLLFICFVARCSGGGRESVLLAIRAAVPLARMYNEPGSAPAPEILHLANLLACRTRLRRALLLALIWILFCTVPLKFGGVIPWMAWPL